MKIIKLITFCILFLGLISCSDDLNQLPKTQITSPNFYKTEQQFIDATNDIYRQMGIVYDADGLVDIGAEQRSDNTYIKQAAGTRIGITRINQFRAGPANEDISEAWEDSYVAIYACNNIINRLENTSVNFSNSTLKQRLIAEATTVRALIYFSMVRSWGAIPFPLKPLSITQSYQYLRESEDVIYDQIINDLSNSKNNLPESYSGTDVGRITKYGAAAILAKVHLTRGETGEAEEELEQIMDSKLYSLDANNDGAINKDDYKHLFQPSTKNSKSSVVEVQYKSGTNAVNSNHQNFYRPFDQRFHPVGVNQTRAGGAGGINTPTEDLTNEFEPADSVRKSISVAPGFYTLDSNEFIDFPYTRKFYDTDYLNAGQNFEIIRYADILLMYAEVTQDPTYLNKVRARVGLPGYDEAGYPNDKYKTLEKAIEHERRMELCFEFHRFFDLKRNGRALEVLQNKGYEITENKLLLPIPQNVIDTNPEITQNPGY